MNQKNQKHSGNTKYLPIGVALGTSLGVACSTVGGNMYLPLGVAVGMAFGLLLYGRSKSKEKDEDKNNG